MMPAAPARSPIAVTRAEALGQQDLSTGRLPC